MYLPLTAKTTQPIEAVAGSTITPPRCLQRHVIDQSLQVALADFKPFELTIGAVPCHLIDGLGLIFLFNFNAGAKKTAT